MNLKDNLDKNTRETKIKIFKKFKSSKFVFIIMGLLFFMNYFLTSNFPKNTLFIKLLPILYIGFITSTILLTYFSIKNIYLGKINNSIFFVILIILIIIGIIFSLPFLIGGEIVKNII